MEFLVSLAACTVALLAFTVATLQHRSMQSKRNSATALKPPPPPGPAGHPLLGSLLYVIGPLRHNPHHSLVALAEAYGPIVYLRLGLTRAMAVISSAAIAHEALVKNDAALAARLVPDNVRALSYGATSMVFLPSSDQLWRQLRVLIGAGSSGQIRPVLECRAGQLAKHIRACAGSGRPVNIREVVNGTVFNVVSNVLFSEDVVDLRDEQQTTFKSLVVPVLEEWYKPSVSVFRFFDEVIIEKRLACGQKHNDILDILLSKMAMSKLTRQQITTFLTDMFIAATDTSTVTVQWAMAELLRHPDKMAKVTTELAEQLGSKDFVTESGLD